MNWKSIRLELASTKEFPSGSVSRVYLLRLPLDDFDRVDHAAFVCSPGKATARRHWSTEPDQRGFIVSSNGEWAIRCDGRDRWLHLDSRPVRLGGSVSIVEADGSVLPFNIASVR
jgi:hypothetical protein